MKVKKLHGLGNHLAIDADTHDGEKISDAGLIRRFLKNLADKINMKIIKGPVVVGYKARDKEESGITGFVILAESHISIHTYPVKQFFSLDIFSCKEFDVREVKNYIRDVFDVKKVKEFLIKREHGK